MCVTSRRGDRSRALARCRCRTGAATSAVTLKPRAVVLRVTCAAALPVTVPGAVLRTPRATPADPTCEVHRAEGYGNCRPPQPSAAPVTGMDSSTDARRTGGLRPRAYALLCLYGGMVANGVPVGRTRRTTW